MKHLYKVYDNQIGDFMFNGEWMTKEEVKDNLINYFTGSYEAFDEMATEKELKKMPLNELLEYGSFELWSHLVIERRTGNIVNGCGNMGIHDLLREDSGYSSDDYMIQANFTFND